MWFPSFALNICDRVDNLVSYESMGQTYGIIKREYKHPIHTVATNTSLPITNKTMIIQEDYSIDASAKDIPAQEAPTINESVEPTPQAQEDQPPLTKGILIKHIHQDL